MKKYLIVTWVLFFLVFLAPSISFAAPLTQTQAESLISVVQASPNTPASAFTNLITAFSNITVAQADSLIVVVQATVGVPPNAFVNLLTSFTQDTQAVVSAPVTASPTEQPIQSVTSQANTVPVATSIEVITSYPNQNTNITPNVQQEADLNSICQAITLWPIIFDQNGNRMPDMPFTFTNPDTGSTTTYAWFQYTSNATDTTKVINYTYGSLNGTYTINYGDNDDCDN